MHIRQCYNEENGLNLGNWNVVKWLKYTYFTYMTKRKVYLKRIELIELSKSEFRTTLELNNVYIDKFDRYGLWEN